MTRLAIPAAPAVPALRLSPQTPFPHGGEVVRCWLRVTMTPKATKPPPLPQIGKNLSTPRILKITNSLVQRRLPPRRLPKQKMATCLRQVAIVENSSASETAENRLDRLKVRHVLRVFLDLSILDDSRAIDHESRALGHTSHD